MDPGIGGYSEMGGTPGGMGGGIIAGQTISYRGPASYQGPYQQPYANPFESLKSSYKPEVTVMGNESTYQVKGYQYHVPDMRVQYEFDALNVPKFEAPKYDAIAPVEGIHVQHAPPVLKQSPPKKTWCC